MVGKRLLKTKKRALCLSKNIVNKIIFVFLPSINLEKSLEDDRIENNLFVSIEIVHDIRSIFSMNIDGHYLEFDSNLLDKVNGALK